MRITRVISIALCATVMACALAAPASAAGLPCDRACLRTTLDAYLNAVIKHDPAGAPLMIGFRQTENAIVVRPGNGLWKSMTGLGAMQRRYVDAVTGQAAYFGIIKEGNAQAVVTVRVKVDDRKISEAEWIVARAGEFGPNGPNGNVFNAESLAANPPPERTVPKAQRLTRESLIAITNSYFDGLTTHDGNIIEHEPGCTRVENGTVMTNRPGRNGGPPGGDCASGRRHEDRPAVGHLRHIPVSPGRRSRARSDSPWLRAPFALRGSSSSVTRTRTRPSFPALHPPHPLRTTVRPQRHCVPGSPTRGCRRASRRPRHTARRGDIRGTRARCTDLVGLIGRSVRTLNVAEKSVPGGWWAAGGAFVEVSETEARGARQTCQVLFF